MRRQRLHYSEALRLPSDQHHIRKPAFDRKGNGIEVQDYGLDADRNLVCCGVHWVPTITPRYIWRLYGNWRRWRRWYDNLPENSYQDYPAKHTPPVAWWGAHPVDDPQAVKWLRVK